jgi:hypothetical protein
MHFGTMSVRTAFRFPRIPWLPSSLRNPPPLQREKPSSRKTEGAVDSAGSADRRASSLGGDCDLIYVIMLSCIPGMTRFSVIYRLSPSILSARTGFASQFVASRSRTFPFPEACPWADTFFRSSVVLVTRATVPRTLSGGDQGATLHREGLKVARRAPAPADFLPLLSTENP